MESCQTNPVYSAAASGRLRTIGFLLALFAAALLLPISGEARSPGFSVQRLKEDTRILSSDAFEGRAPLTPGEDKTLAYLARSMRDIGLEPGVGKSYLQPVPLVQTQTRTSPAPRFAVSGRLGRADFVYEKEVTLNTWGAGTSDVRLAGSKLVFVGYGISAPEKGWNDYAGVDVHGKTVLILVNDPDWEKPTVDGPFGGKAMTYYGRYDYKFEEAARQGAAAAVIIHKDAAAGYPFSVPASSLVSATTALDVPNEGTDSLKVRSWMAHPAAEKLLALAGEDLDVLEKAAAVPGFKARPLDARADIAFEVDSKRGVSANVIGLLRGTTRPHEFVVYTAHWDHLGRCPPDATGDDICNGAIDNAVGVAGMLELARAFRCRGPTPRSILFISTTGEEQGFLGAKYYVSHPVYPLAKTVADVDIDPLNFMLGGPARNVPLIADRTELAAVVREAAASQNRMVTTDSSPEQGNRYRSDTLAFSRGGVPVVVVGTGLDIVGKPEGWGRAALDRYNEHHYHQPSDAFDPNWDWSGAVQDLAFFYRVGDRLARSEAWPNWYPEDEFRPARDAVLANGGK